MSSMLVRTALPRSEARGRLSAELLTVVTSTDCRLVLKRGNGHPLLQYVWQAELREPVMTGV